MYTKILLLIFVTLLVETSALQTGKSDGGATLSNITIGNAPKLYMVNNSLVVPGISQLLEFDVSSQKYRLVSDKLYGSSFSVSGSCLCGDNFFAVITNIPYSFGLVKVNVKTGSVDHLDSNGYLFHKITCDPEGDDNTFIGTASQPPIFSLQRYNATSQSTKIVGEFPRSVGWAGWDSIFSFDFKNNVLLAAFAKLIGGLPKGAVLFEMDLSSGAVSGPKDFQCSKAVQTIIASGKDQFFGTTIVPDLDLVQMCLFDKSGSTVKVLHCKDSQGGHTMGVPYPVCNNQLYTLIQPVSQPGSSDGLYVTDLSDLSEKKIADVETIIPYAYVGAMAC